MRVGGRLYELLGLKRERYCESGAVFGRIKSHMMTVSTPCRQSEPPGCCQANADNGRFFSDGDSIHKRPVRAACKVSAQFPKTTRYFHTSKYHHRIDTHFVQRKCTSEYHSSPSFSSA